MAATITPPDFAASNATANSTAGVRRSGGPDAPRSGESGETVLVLGASGGVGHAALQLAHAMGARVLAGFLRPERTASVRAAGADAVIDLSAADLRDRLVPRLHRRLH